MHCFFTESIWCIRWDIENQAQSAHIKLKCPEHQGSLKGFYSDLSANLSPNLEQLIANPTL